MVKFIYFMSLPIAIFIIIFLLNKLRKKTTDELEKILYLQNNPRLYLQLLRNPKLKLLYSKSVLLQFELNAYLLSGEDNQIEKIIQLLDAMPMTKGQSLEYHQKKLSYYCTLGKKEKAENALKKIENILSKVKGKYVQFILKEGKMIFDIYIRHDTSLMKELEQAQREEQGVTRGLTLYRLAKLSFFDHNDKNTQAYLIQARELLVNTVWFDIVEAALKDRSILNYK